MSEPDDALTSMIGKDVYSSNGVRIGRVADAQMDFTQKEVSSLAVEDVNEDLFGELVRNAPGLLVPYRWVRQVADIIIVADVIEQYSRAVTSSEMASASEEQDVEAE